MELEKIDNTWDLVVVGGGITGAGVLREAVRMGLKTLLVEKMDFAWGTSSRSSKLVHGGLRYLKQGQLYLTYESVRQRQRLLQEAPGLVSEIDFLMPVYKKKGPGRLTLSMGLALYDMMARKRYHSYYKKDEFAGMVPGLDTDGLSGGFRFMDAQTDDVRLVLRLISEAREKGGTAINYTAVTRINRDDAGTLTGITMEDTETGASRTVSTPAVINATGAWAESLHPVHESGMHLRPLRGSHLVIPLERLPLDHAVTLIHPQDSRPLFIIPWEGALILGTTDIDHGGDINTEITATPQEATYMLECLNAHFPDAKVTLADCVASYAGIRPVLTKKESTDPSKESREHVIWSDNGLVTVTGGKLTTFRILAADAIKAAENWLPEKSPLDLKAPAFEPVQAAPDETTGLSAETWQKLYGRYGKQADAMIKNATEANLSRIPGTHTLWAELPFLAQTEHIRHLTDLLLRRVRIGMLLPEGGREHLPRIRQLCEPALPWDNDRWEAEIRMYLDYVSTALGVPRA